MYITLDEDKIRLIIDALQKHAAEYRLASISASDEGYPESTAKQMLKTSVAAHDLCDYLEKQIDERDGRRTQRTDTQKVDPYDIQWPINDPRKW